MEAYSGKYPENARVSPLWASPMVLIAPVFFCERSSSYWDRTDNSTGIVTFRVQPFRSVYSTSTARSSTMFPDIGSLSAALVLRSDSSPASGLSAKSILTVYRSLMGVLLFRLSSFTVRRLKYVEFAPATVTSLSPLAEIVTLPFFLLLSVQIRDFPML